jgi:hypothetical protein
MSLLRPEDESRLREDFKTIERRVHVLFFTQTLGCETCLQTRQILDELPPLSDKIVIDEINFILEPERAREYGIDRVPAIALAWEDGADPSAALHDTRIRFLGMPAGYEFISLVQALQLAGGRPSQLSEQSRQRLTAVERPMTVHVFTTPT